MKIKTKINYFFAIILSLSMAVVSCSSNDDTAPAKEIAKEYKAADVTATNNGKELAGVTVDIKAIDNKNVKLTLNNVVNGHPSFEMSAIVTSVTKASSYQFLGAKEVDGMEVTVDGTIVDGKVTIETLIKITSNVVGKWSLNVLPAEPEKDIYDERFDISVKVTNKTGKVMFQKTEMTCEKFSYSLGGLIGTIAKGYLTSHELDINQSGYVSFKGVLDTGKDVPLDYPEVSRYYYDVAKKVLSFDAVIPDMPTMVVPFNCEVKDGVMTASIGKDFFGLYLSFIPDDLKSLLPEQAQMYSDMINEIVKIAKDADEFTVTLKLVPSK